MLYLIRHSLPVVDLSIPPMQWQLSRVGIERAQQLADRLTDRGIQRIVSSSELKAIQTAQILADHLGVPTEVAEGLHEHERSPSRDLKDSQKAFESLVGKLFAEPDQLVFGNETANQTLVRFKAALQKVITRHAGQSLAVVSHGTAITLFLSYTCNLDAFTFWQHLGLPEYISLEMPGFRIVENWHPPIENEN